jgi:hypothetical protein
VPDNLIETASNPGSPQGCRIAARYRDREGGHAEFERDSGEPHHDAPSRSWSPRGQAQKTITDRATSPDSIAANASLTSSSLISREISSSSLSAPRL